MKKSFFLNLLCLIALFGLNIFTAHHTIIYAIKKYLQDTSAQETEGIFMDLAAEAAGFKYILIVLNNGGSILKY